MYRTSIYFLLQISHILSIALVGIFLDVFRIKKFFCSFFRLTNAVASYIVYGEKRTSLNRYRETGKIDISILCILFAQGFVSRGLAMLVSLFFMLFLQGGFYKSKMFLLKSIFYI